MLFAVSAVHAEVVRQDQPVVGITRELGYLPGAEGGRLAYVVYRPATQERYPTVATFDVYGGGSMAPTGMVQGWVKRGYAFVAASARGTGCSDGDYVPFNLLAEARDGRAFVEWAGRQDWSTGKVGLIGNSQPGLIQFGIAALKPRHLAAIAPGGTLNRLYADLWYPGGVYNRGFVTSWGRRQQPLTSRAGADARILLGDQACMPLAAKIGPNQLEQRVSTQPLDGDYYRQASPYYQAPAVTVPTLMVQSWTDQVVGSGALWVFERIRSSNKRLFVLNGGHEAYLYSTAQEEVRRWMDRWVKGISNGVDSEPRVRVDFETQVSTLTSADADAIQVESGWTGTLRDWPAPETRWSEWFLRRDGGLSEQAPAEPGAGGERVYFHPHDGERATAAASAEWESLAYRTAPVDADVTILGSPQLQFYASSQSADTDFMVTLNDISADGQRVFLQRSFLRASHRAVDARRSTDQMAFHPHDAEQPLIAGEIYLFRISVPPMAYVLRAGHALELQLAESSSSRSSPGLSPTMLARSTTIYHSAQQPSQLRIPLMPGVRAPASVPLSASPQHIQQ